MSDTIYCSNCGALNSAKSKFCSECGSNLGKDGSPTSKEESPDTCPSCKQNDKAESVITIFQTQSSLVGYGKNRDVRQTALAQTIGLPPV